MRIFLQPGDLHFGSGDVHVSTLLGSCVSITLWHPVIRVGGMCHYVLPSRRGVGPQAAAELDGRYADEAMRLFQREIARTPSRIQEYEVGMFGGGRQLPRPSTPGGIDIPTQNVDAGWRLVTELGLSVKGHHLGGHGPRQVSLDLRDGTVLLRHLTGQEGRIQ